MNLSHLVLLIKGTFLKLQCPVRQVNSFKGERLAEGAINDLNI